MKSIFSLLTLFGLLFASTISKADTDYQAVMTQVIERGDQAVAAYNPQESIRFGNEFSQLYFGGFESEGLEFAVGQADNQKMIAIELGFSSLINAAVTGKPKVEVEAAWQSLREKLVAAPMIEGHTSSYTELVVQSLLILLREGVEALLVIAALLAYLRKSGAGDRASLVWLGGLAALVASGLTAWGLQTLLTSSGSTKETIEGVSLLVAALLLSYVSAWLFSRREIAQWQSFIHNRLDNAVGNGSMLAIVSVAFLAVYREGAETILFYQALISGANYNWEPILIGFALASVALVLVYFLIFILSVKLPLKLFFTGTATLLFVLSVVFAGKSTVELQVAGWLPNTPLDWMPTIGWLGVFPSLEALLFQLGFLLLPILVFGLFKMTQSSQQPAQQKA